MNPRPRHFHVEVYILILFMMFLSRHQETGLQEIAFQNDPSTLKARLDGFQPYMTPIPELGWPPGEA